MTTLPTPTATEQAKTPRVTFRLAEVFAIVMVTIVLVFGLDQLTKQVIARSLGRGADEHRINLLSRHIAFEYVENTGAAFGFLAGNTWLVSVLAGVVAIGFLVVFASHLRESLLLQVGLGLVLAGGAGNIIDRIRLGYVVDFLAVGIWPRFNVADSAITLGVGGMVWWLLSSSMEEEPD